MPRDIARFDDIPETPGPRGPWVGDPAIYWMAALIVGTLTLFGVETWLMDRSVPPAPVRTRMASPAKPLTLPGETVVMIQLHAP